MPADLFASEELQRLEAELGGAGPPLRPPETVPTLLGVDFTRKAIETSRWGLIPLSEEALGLIAKIALSSLEVELSRQMQATRERLSRELGQEYDRLGVGIVDRVLNQALAAGQSDTPPPAKDDTSPDAPPPVVMPEKAKRRMPSGRVTPPSAIHVSSATASKSVSRRLAAIKTMVPSEPTPPDIQAARDLGSGAPEGA